MISQTGIDMVPSVPAGELAWPSGKRAWSMAAVLMAANSLAFIDRQALALLIEPIKQQFGSSDTEMSIVYGLSFALLYVGAGIPIAWLADRSDRRNIVIGSILFWSTATAACGLARNYASLFFCRLAVGAGEAGLSPASYSLLADYFPRERLAGALGLYHAGIYLGGATALLLGGMIAGFFPLHIWFEVPLIGNAAGWQIVFLCLGLPGVLLAAILLFMREPARRRAAAERADLGASLGDSLRHMKSHGRVYFGMLAGFTMLVLVGNATGAWIPAFLEREYAMSVPEIGRAYGLMVLIFGLSGALAGGLFASWLLTRGVARGNLVAAVISFTALIPLTVAFPLMPDAPLALALIGAMNFFGGFGLGGGLAALIELTPNRMRAQVSMIYGIAINLVGASLGPAIVALLTDFVFRDPQRLGHSIAVTSAVCSPLALVALIIAWRAMPGKAGAA